MSKSKYTYQITKRYRDHSFIGEDSVYRVSVKAESIDDAEKKAKALGEVKTAYNPDHYVYKVELLEIEE